MSIPRDSIDPDAEKVVRRLNKAGYKAYLVGGCVRDLLLSRTPKDFDVSTSATPREIRALFRNCRIIGRRFRLAHIFFGQKIIETSTFRANPRQDADDEDGELLIRHDNVFGSETEDARRRDFTINGLFYDVETESVIDHVGGMADLEARVIRTIGDPDIRFREDPVRILRAIKFAARLGFSIEPVTYAALVRHREEINKCAAPRVLEEFYRLLRGGAARRSMELLVETGVAATLSPHLAALLGGYAAAADLDDVDDETGLFNGEEDDDFGGDRDAGTSPPELPFDPADLRERRAAAWRMLDAVDDFVRDGRDPTNALLLAALIAPFVADDVLAQGVRPIEANERVLQLVQPLVAELHIARRDAERARQVVLALRRLVPSKRRRGRPMTLVRRDYFDEALALYELFARARELLLDDVERWRRLRDGAHGRPDAETTERKRRRRRRGGRRRRRSRAVAEAAADAIADAVARGADGDAS
ncbi:MAG: polynucleotide adenylyltransferase PcnB [Deltaproteobacteria bacterium]|nr:MAG: polynucleotide adenylyltransferase PcnB [Deltaproteobacteria bacterium]